MPLSKLTFKPGINKEGTNYSNEGGYYNCDKIRFRSGFAEKIGGWRNQSYNYTYKGVCRAMFNWVTYDTANLLAVGTSCKYYIENGGFYYDITPIRSGPTTLSANPIDTVAGLKVVTVNAALHGATAGTFVTITSTATAGGLTISGEYQIIATPTANAFTIASATAAAFTASGGGTVTVTYQLNAGGATVTIGLGWGAGAWSSGGWGASVASTSLLPQRYWAQDTYQQDLILCEIGGNIYYWEKNTASIPYPRAVTLQSYCDTQFSTQVYTVGPTASGSTSIVVDTTDGIFTGSIIVGTNIPAGTYVTTAWTYSTTLTLSAATTAIIASGTALQVNYAGLHAPNKTNFLISSDTSYFTLVLGSKPYNPSDFNPTYDPMLVRWSDQNNPYEWVPAATNQAGEQHLSNGSYLISAINTRQELLVWSDAAVYSMQYVGPPYVWNFTLIGDNTSLISPNAIIAVNTVVYWMGVDKFYIYNGRLETLGCTLWKFVYDNLNRAQQSQVVCGSNEGFSEIWWHYPSSNSQVNNSYIIYNYLEGTWYYGTMSRSYWLDSPLRSSPMAAFSVQNSVLSYDPLNPLVIPLNDTATSVVLVDGSSYPNSGTVTIDSEQIAYTSVSNNTLLGCTRGVNGTSPSSHVAYSSVTYNVPNQIMFHEVGSDDQSTTTAVPIAAYLESSDVDIDDGNNFAFVWRVIPDLTFRGSTAESPRVMLSLKARINSGSAYTTAFTDPTNVTRTAIVPVEQYTGQVYTRIRGRQMAFRVDSSDLGVSWQVGAMRIDIRPDGRR
jgi:hypothetical protein